MKIADCMSRDVQTVTPDQPIREAAQCFAPMRARCRWSKTIGDRRSLTATSPSARCRGPRPDTPVREAMSEQILVCYEDEDIEEVAMKMSDARSVAFRCSAATMTGWSASSRW